MTEWGKMLRRLRIDAGMTQDALAEKAGLSQTRLSRLENGYGQPSARTLEKILDALGYELAVKKSRGRREDD